MELLDGIWSSRPGRSGMWGHHSTRGGLLGVYCWRTFTALLAPDLLREFLFHVFIWRPARMLWPVYSDASRSCRHRSEPTRFRCYVLEPASQEKIRCYPSQPVVFLV